MLPHVTVGAMQAEAVGAQQAAMEASLSVEVSMIVLDTVTLYVNSFKVNYCEQFTQFNI